MAFIMDTRFELVTETDPSLWKRARGKPALKGSSKKRVHGCIREGKSISIKEITKMFFFPG